MAWCRIGDKPLSEPMLTRFTAALGGDELTWNPIGCSEVGIRIILDLVWPYGLAQPDVRLRESFVCQLLEVPQYLQHQLICNFIHHYRCWCTGVGNTRASAAPGLTINLYKTPGKFTDSELRYGVEIRMYWCGLCAIIQGNMLSGPWTSSLQEWMWLVGNPTHQNL